MVPTPRRSFLHLAFSALPLPLLRWKAFQNSSAPQPVKSGKDREGKTRAVGVSSTAYKVSTQETGGAMFVMEQTNAKKGGPSQHVHHGEDELFYVIEGEYIVELGSKQFRLRAGDCMLEGVMDL